MGQPAVCCSKIAHLPGVPQMYADVLADSVLHPAYLPPAAGCLGRMWMLCAPCSAVQVGHVRQPPATPLPPQPQPGAMLARDWGIFLIFYLIVLVPCPAPVAAA